MSSFLKCYIMALGICLSFSVFAAQASESGIAKGAVVSSIKPLHSLVEAVLGDSGSSLLLIDGAASMHNYQLKPSQQRALSTAQIVFFIDANAETFLNKAFSASGSTGRLVALADDPAISLLKKRRGDDWQNHDHEKQNRDKDSPDPHQEHGTDVDLHIWLDPRNAKPMVRNIEAVLKEIFPDHAAEFGANAQAVVEELNQLDSSLERAMQPFSNRAFIVFHDAFGYFERRYSLNAAGSVLIDASLSPSVSQIRTIRQTIESTSAVCVFSEPQFSKKIISVIVEGKNVKSARVDPLGANINAGKTLYFELMRNLAANFEACLS